MFRTLIRASISFVKQEYAFMFFVKGSAHGFDVIRMINEHVMVLMGNIKIIPTVKRIFYMSCLLSVLLIK